jgi:hypothetical protein
MTPSVLAADRDFQIYDPDLVVPLCATLRLFLTQTPKASSPSHDDGLSNRFVLLAATVRNQETTERFYVECGKSAMDFDLHVKKQKLVADHDRRIPVRIYERQTG